MFEQQLGGGTRHWGRRHVAEFVAHIRDVYLKASKAGVTSRAGEICGTLANRLRLNLKPLAQFHSWRINIVWNGEEEPNA